MTPLTIDRLGAKGDGLADGPDGPVAVAFTLPGEQVVGAIADGRIDAPRILTPSQDRVRAPCPHFRQCGGCMVQHASDALVENWKGDQVVAALARHGIEAGRPRVDTSPPQSRIRATLSGRRTKKGALVGFHGRGSDQIVPITDCTVLHPDILSAMPVLTELTIRLAARKGAVQMAVSRSDNGLDVDLSGGKPLDAAMVATLSTLAGAAGVVRLSHMGDVIAQHAAPVQTFGPARVVPPPGAFLQATEHGRDALVAFAETSLAGAAVVADLFCGVGTFALPLARSAEIAAFEADSAMIAALDLAGRMTDGLKPVVATARDLFRRPLMAEELARFDGVLLDPPRAGAAAQVAELAKSTVPCLVYVSCNPVTFARDAAVLQAGGYQLQGLLVVDQFRWSPHVELAASFRRI